MTRELLIKKVALKMDEISSSDEVIIPVNIGDNNPLYTQIDNLLDESINEVLSKAPTIRIQDHIFKSDTSITTEDIFNGKRKRAVISVPDDFIRLISISDDCFQRPIVEFSFEGDEIDRRQHNKYLVSKKAKPVAIISHTGNGQVIYCYSYDADDTPNPSLLYVKRYDGYGAVDVNLDQYLIDTVTWVCAGKVFSARGDMANSKSCYDNASALMS